MNGRNTNEKNSKDLLENIPNLKDKNKNARKYSDRNHSVFESQRFTQKGKKKYLKTNVNFSLEMKETMIDYFKRETIVGVNEFPEKYEPSKPILYLALGVIIFSNVGTYFNYDICQILDDNFRILFQVSSKDVVQLYTVYYIFSFPLTIFGGFMISYIGAMTTVVFLSYIIFLGSISSVYAAISANFTFIWIARAADGFAAEVNDIAINTVISIWFKGKFLSLAIALGQFCNSLSATSTTFLTVRIFEKFRDIDKVYIVASFMCCFSSICTLVFQFLDLRREKVNAKYKKLEQQRKKAYNKEHGNEDEEEEQGEKISLDMFKNLNNKQIWGMIGTALFSDAVYFCFTFFTTELLTKRFFFTTKESSNYMAILPLSAMFSSPIFGAVTVKYGKKMSMLIIAYIVVISGLVSLYLMPYRKVPIVAIPFAIIGAFKGVSSSFIWSGMALVTPESSVPLAFCIAELSSNLITAGISYIFGEIIENEKKENFQILIVIMICFCCVGMITTIYTYFQDKRRGGILELPENELKAIGIKKIIDFRGNRCVDILKYLQFAEEKIEEREEEIAEEKRRSGFES